MKDIEKSVIKVTPNEIIERCFAETDKANATTKDAIVHRRIINYLTKSIR